MVKVGYRWHYVRDGNFRRKGHVRRCRGADVRGGGRKCPDARLVTRRTAVDGQTLAPASRLWSQPCISRQSLPRVVWFDFSHFTSHNVRILCFSHLSDSRKRMVFCLFISRAIAFL